MKRTDCLVALRHVTPSSEDKQPRKNSGDINAEEDEGRWEYDLLPPNKVRTGQVCTGFVGLRDLVQIAIIDDTAAYVLFDTVYSAPQEDCVRSSVNISPPTRRYFHTYCCRSNNFIQV